MQSVVTGASRHPKLGNSEWPLRDCHCGIDADRNWPSAARCGQFPVSRSLAVDRCYLRNRKAERIVFGSKWATAAFKSAYQMNLSRSMASEVRA